MTFMKFGCKESILHTFYLWPPLISLRLHKLCQKLDIFILQTCSKCALAPWCALLTKALHANRGLTLLRCLPS